jgi:hypothetical protein
MFLPTLVVSSLFPPRFFFCLVFVLFFIPTLLELLKHSVHHPKLQLVLFVVCSLQQCILLNFGNITSGWIISCFLSTLPPSPLSVLF